MIDRHNKNYDKSQYFLKNTRIFN